MMDGDFGLEAQLVEAKRELAMREGVYPRWVADGKLTQSLANRRLELMRAIVNTLERVAANDRLI